MRIFRYRRSVVGVSKAIQYRLCVLGIYVWTSNFSRNYGWFRFFGFGIKWKNYNFDNNILFSERNKKRLTIGKWVISYLPENKNKKIKRCN